MLKIEKKMNINVKSKQHILNKIIIKNIWFLKYHLI